MEEYESLRSFLEHVALVMDAEQNENLDAVNIMTLHSAKGLEFETVFLPGWEEGLFPHQRALDEGGRSGLEEERRLAYVGLTRAKKNLHIWFVSNRRIHGLWQSTIPSRFLEELPEAHVEVVAAGDSYGGYGGGGGYEPLWLGKEKLNQHGRCEGLFQAVLAGEAPPFAHSPRSAHGVLLHKAIEVQVGARDGMDPHEMAQVAVGRVLEREERFGEYWRELSRASRTTPCIEG